MVLLPLDVHTAALRHLLAVLVLRLAHLTTPAGSPALEPDPTYLRFRDAVERDFARTRRVEHYAQSAARIADQLGFPSPTHFSKFFHRGTGQTPVAFRDTVRGHSAQ